MQLNENTVNEAVKYKVSSEPLFEYQMVCEIETQIF